MSSTSLFYQPPTKRDQEITVTDNPEPTKPSVVVASPPRRPIPCEEQRKNMKSEKDRLSTYLRWPNQYISPKELAKAGFFSIQFEDSVRCAFCRVEVCRWEEGDNAMADHQRWSNTCPFIRGLDVGNIPLDPNDTGASEPPPKASYDTCGRYGIEIRPNSVSESEHNINLNKLGITPSKSPAFPMYATTESRMRSFKEWPPSIKQRPEELADAGFFYIGKGDQTMCFSCGGGLKDWLEGDDPWEQHARWFTKCSFVLTVKGREFVSEVISRLPAVLSPQQGAELRVSEAGASTATAAAPPAVAVKTEEQGPAPLPAVEKKVDDGRLCKICYTEELGVVFLPCGHIVACVKCAPSLSTCAVCRQPFTAIVRAFLS